VSRVQEAIPAASEPNAAAKQLYVPALFFAACLSAQLYLVFFKSFNWDEFLHYNFVYQLNAGTLNLPFQVLHLRTLWWVPQMSEDIVGQMLAARVFIWVIHLLTLLMIYGLARNFTNVANSLFAAFAYLTAGYVFTQAFSIRSDPFVTATLMGALFLMASGKLSLLKALVIGALIGLAGLMTLKAVLYAPCFAGLAWLRLQETQRKAEFLGKLTVILIAAMAIFGALYLYYGSANVAEVGRPAERTSELSFYLRWFTIGGPHASYIGGAAIFCLPFLVCLVVAPFAWKRAGLKPDSKLALLGFVAPLASLLFYKNTFPYFFVFILAPAAVAIAPALGLARDRYGNAFLSLALSLIPLALAVLEPRDVLVRQRALIDYVHREFPEKPGYLDYSYMIVDYPRILPFLTSGNGARLYIEQGDAIVGREIDRGNVPFIIANKEEVLAALEDRPVPGIFLPVDLAAMRGNYVRQWDVLWREGRFIPAGTGTFEFQLRRGGNFVLDGNDLVIDGQALSHGTSITLSKGHHVVGGERNAPSTLWRGGRLPSAPPNVPMGEMFTKF